LVSIPDGNYTDIRHAMTSSTLPFFLLLLALWHSRLYMTTAKGGGFLSYIKNSYTINIYFQEKHNEEKQEKISKQWFVFAWSHNGGCHHCVT